MDSIARYEILRSLAKTDSTTVYRGRDRDSGRDIAIKEIQSQFLSEPDLLQKYWQDIRLVASLQHPDIVRIEEILPERGWLIEELVTESLPRLLSGRGIDMHDLRITLEHALSALQALHETGLVHGDVRPENLLADQSQAVKLGDFSFTTRLPASNGQIVRRAAKYIAPEAASDRFGPVGPHSDLYALGFSAYKLLCGRSFESFFPDLRKYDRDWYAAWMKWHADPAARAPEVHQVVEGVPIDLACVIWRLIEKDPAQRYQNAAAVLADLRGDDKPTAPLDAFFPPRPSHHVTSPLPSAAPTLSPSRRPAPSGAPRRPPRERSIPWARWLTVGILGACLGGGAALISRQYRGTPRTQIASAAISSATVSDAAPTTLATVVSEANPAAAHEQTVPEAPAQEDTVELTGAQSAEGPLMAIDVSSSMLTVGVRGGRPIRVRLNEATRCTVNGQSLEPELLRPGDYVALAYEPHEDGNVAVQIDALRRHSLTGWLASAAEGQIAISADGPGGLLTGEPLVLPLAEDCVITLNGQTQEEGRPLSLLQLRRDDRVTVDHDTRVRKIEAFRDVSESGVVRQVDLEGRAFVMTRDDGGVVVVRLSPACRIQIESKPVEFSALRVGDQVIVERSSSDASNREVIQLSITPAPDSRFWALVLSYDSRGPAQLPAIRFSEADRDELIRTLRQQYRVPHDQLQAVHNARRQRLQETVTDLLRRVPSDGRLLVYFLGHGFLDPHGTAYLVTQDFDPQQPGVSGTALSWLVQQVEACRAEEKLIVLDTTHDGIQLPDPYPSAAELIESLPSSPGEPPSKSVFLLASCGQGEASRKAGRLGRGLFALGVCDALSGLADVNRDHCIEAAELYSYLRGTLPRQLGLLTQTPVFFLPADAPNRLPLAAQTAIQNMLAYLQRDVDEQFFQQHDHARALSAEQPDAALAFTLVMLKAGRLKEAEAASRDAALHHPETAPIHHLLAWLAFADGRYREAASHLEDLARGLPREGDEATQRYVDHALESAGRLSAVAELVRRELKLADVQTLRQAVAARGEEAKESYRRGYYFVRDRLTDLNHRLGLQLTATERAAIQQTRDATETYVTFDYGALEAYLRHRLNH